ncbi:hypothetical protein BpHYR1_025333 [Brachionus plicatilis]|uniref:Uncharacterized protein n=1 Tax=Brachionus plicatilis TaxID=10195 RepID=A0A3M7RJL1_BRAPC|nr:hypothetical protein BpHYR1_025333 [Brachionus plicatilis]
MLIKRWDSEYLMIERILEQVDNAIEVLYATRKHRHLVLKLAEKNILKLIADFFETFHNLTKIISCEKYPSCNFIFYLIFSLRKKYAGSNSDTNAIGKFLKSTMLDSVNIYVRECKLSENKKIIFANFLTPNRKNCNRRGSN